MNFTTSHIQLICFRVSSCVSDGLRTNIGCGTRDPVRGLPFGFTIDFKYMCVGAEDTSTTGLKDDNESFGNDSNAAQSSGGALCRLEIRRIIRMWDWACLLVFWIVLVRQGCMRVWGCYR